MMLQWRMSPVVLVSLACCVLSSCVAKERNFKDSSGHSGAQSSGGRDASVETGGDGGGGSGGLGGGGAAGTIVAGGASGKLGAGGGGGSAAGGGPDAGPDGGFVCTPGTDFCDGVVLMRCNADSSSTVKLTCGPGKYCEQAQLKCLTQNCSPKTYTCSGSQPQVCPSDGSHFQDYGPKCSGKDPICEGEGNCVCTPGFVRCSPDGTKLPQVCNDQNVWVNAGAPCTSAVYDGCDDNTGRCVTKSILVEYGQWMRTEPVSGKVTATQVSQFSLDQYEVTVGQFRRFVAAWIDQPNNIQGWRPNAGDGKHVHIRGANGKVGLVNVLQNDTTADEPGWNTDWAINLSTALGDDSTGWNYTLRFTGGPPLVLSPYATWTANVGDNEDKPINLVTWQQAYAYCIWDGGFLPTAAEWQWAAQGGQNKWTYPWNPMKGANPMTGVPGPDTKLAVYGCLLNPKMNKCDGVNSIANVDAEPATAGAARWGHAHMAGNVWEWVLDWHKGDPNYSYPSYPDPCVDCARLDPTPPDPPLKMDQGGDFYFDAAKLKNNAYRLFQWDWVDHYGGFRCARPG